jgi:tetratricopeptide (TPR) repeat protein
VLDFLVQDVLEGADPWLGGADRPVSELLRAASSRVSRRFRAQPEVEAEVLATLGRVFLTSGRLDEAEAHHRRALELRRAAFGERSPEVAESLHSLGWVRVQRHRLADAEPLIRQSLELRTALLPAGHPDLADTLRSLAICREGQGALEEARELYDRSLALYRAIGGGKNSGVADVLLSRAILLHKCGELAEAEAAAREALERRLSFYDAESPAHGNPHLILGRILGDRGAPEEAGRHLRKAVALFRKGGDRSYEADALTLLGELEAGRGNLGEAEERLLQAVEMGRGIDDPQAAALRRISLASVQAQLGDLEGGAKAFQEVVPGLRKRQGLPARQMASILEQYARIQERRGRTEEAEQLRAEAALLLRTPR